MVKLSLTFAQRAVVAQILDSDPDLEEIVSEMVVYRDLWIGTQLKESGMIDNTNQWCELHDVHGHFPGSDECDAFDETQQKAQS